ncbi:hypothetical protein [Saccharothrix sp. Mg75]|uniref:hypothetical protein n=1 Tax=Saccharothrix sp. Mg75 TaxID=3445357 RepID=UPI003EED9C0F
MVDTGRHTFILNTVDYARFCQGLAGRFIHHVPDDTTDPAESTDRVTATVTAIHALGYRIDPALWPRAGADCTQCYADSSS